MLLKTFRSPARASRLKNATDVRSSREDYFKNRSPNLTYLLHQRYSWMNSFLNGREKVIEVGSGSGFAKEFIRNKNLKLTDVKKYEWIDLEVDALDTPFENETIDVVIATNMIHHLARPLAFLKEMARILKPNGYLLIHEVHNSLLMKIILIITRHEGWSYEDNVFDINTLSCDPDDPWSANCAVPFLLFHDPKKFETHLKEFKVLKNELCEGLIFPLSGGVTAKIKTFRLPLSLLKTVDRLDQILIKLWPDIFALGRRVVLQKCQKTNS